ncbi:glycosyltransferase family 4 protein [Sphingomonas morindae]|uniref:Glycosyltransferase family 4 protein n=1 Tax=Sphingomonas morindae TaxID=1541170 RepID=A0ABY4X781_9SPHN|nr:glycosyltransferase family 4 protein [Sphingomonas morindae]USI72470.1 glycosyltransferase family 4 protein [Sphingomonas morindae]
MSRPINIMVWNAARGGMRSVVEAYRRDGLIDSEHIELVAAYADGGFAKRQMVLAAALARFARLIATRKIGFVHIHASMRGSFWRKGLFASMARARGIPVVLHLHGSEMKLFYNSQPAFAQKLIRQHLEAATRVVVLSESWRVFVGSIAPRAQITVLPNYVTVPPAVDPASRPDEAVLFLGLVGDRKGVFDLLPAFAEVVRHHPAAKLVIGGNGEVERGEAEMRRLGLDGPVRFAGWVDGAARDRLIAEAGIYVLPSHNEGLPMSVLEAMAAGLAVVTTRVGGIPELITDGVDGLLVDAGDQAALAAALGRLIGDPALRARIAAAGRARIEAQYSDRAVLPQLRAIYQQCLAGRAG